MDTNAGAATTSAATVPIEQKRLWERTAYGRGSSDHERSSALELLAEAFTADQSRTPPPPAPPPSVVPTIAPPADLRALRQDDGSAADGPRPSRRSHLVLALPGAAVLAVVMLAALLGVRPNVQLTAILDEPQVEADLSLPSWLRTAVRNVTAEGRETEAGLLTSVRLLDGTDPEAYVLSDRAGETVCLAAAASFRCEDTQVANREGIELEVLDPDDEALGGGLRLSWGPTGGLVTEHFALRVPARVALVPAAAWAELVHGCLSARGHSARVLSQGAIVPMEAWQRGDLGYALAVWECSQRFPRGGYYFEGAP